MSVLAYSLETVVAEKFEAMISLSVNNSRMKDFFDVYGILKVGKLDKEVLTDAIKNTFHHRGTSYVENHPLFTDNFYKDANRIARWKGFLKGIKWKENIEFEAIGQTIKSELFDYWEILKPEQ